MNTIAAAAVLLSRQKERGKFIDSKVHFSAFLLCSRSFVSAGAIKHELLLSAK
jgi:hypothetical protein